MRDLERMIARVLRKITARAALADAGADADAGC